MFKATVTINPFRCNKNQTAVTGSTLVTALILITPLCGYVFQCGCTWPWAGLDSACNIHDPAAQQRCPWCASQLAGWLSSILSVVSGLIAASLSRTRFFNIKPTIDITIRYAFGLTVFAATAFLSAAIAAKVQHYPIGLFGFDT